MFVDYVKIKIKAGNGGDGATSFRREKYIPDGGPDGGDGGKGGSIYFKVDKDQSTLRNFNWNKKYYAQDGESGSGGKCTGKSGEDLVIGVPKGTIVADIEGKVIADISEEGKEYLALKGGKGGLGNWHFKSSTRRAPNFSIDGEKTDEFEVVLELKSIADVGLLGFPNAGKSTLLSVISKARPKIAGYPFTTLEPNLGVAKDKYGRTFVVADIPGIIEGASEGVGLGFKFLRHIERCRILLHVVDSSGLEDVPLNRVKILNEEVKKYGQKTAEKKQILCINKIDVGNEEYIKELKQYAEKEGIDYVEISGAEHKNVDELLVKIADMLEKMPKDEFVSEEEIIELKSEENDFLVEKITLKKGILLYQVTGKAATRIMGRININDNESMHYLHKILNESGIAGRMRELGIKEGDAVNIAGYEFEWYE